MTSKNDGGPAFPLPNQAMFGMSLRDWFAGQALNGILSDGETQAIISKLSRAENASSTAYVAKAAYEFADAMLKERSK